MRRLCLCSLLAMLALPAPGRAQPSLEYAVKAAYLARFAPFIEWPESAFAGPAAPLTVCVLGPDPFGAELDRVMAGQKDGEHPLAVRRLTVLEDGCHILFTADAALAEQAVAEMRSRPVVTVTDSGLRTRGVISFVLAATHVRFDIDKAAADSVGLRISSKLLGLARNVRQGGGR